MQKFWGTACLLGILLVEFADDQSVVEAYWPAQGLVLNTRVVC